MTTHPETPLIELSKLIVTEINFFLLKIKLIIIII